MAKHKESEEKWTPDQFIESRILTGLIVSTDFLRRVYDIWDDSYIASDEVALVAGWVFDYFERYGAAPDQHIQDIYYHKTRPETFDKDRAEFIELMLERASESYGRGRQFNSDYLFDQTREYFRQRHYRIYAQEIQELADAGETNEAARKQFSFVDIQESLDAGFFLDSREAMRVATRAFSERERGVVWYPPPFGEMVNQHLVRDGFVAFLAGEKRGKSFMLMDVGMRALRQHNNVAFFEAGDMSQTQLMKRICTYLERASVESFYPSEGKILKPVKDCIYNQTDQCNYDERECDFGPFDDREPRQLRSLTNGLTIDDVKDAMERDPDYRPCRNCKEYKSGKPWGSVWFREVELPTPMSPPAARAALHKHLNKYKNRLKLLARPASTLSPADIRAHLDQWERQHGFIPDVICIAERSLVLTDRGLVPIEDITCSDRLWDGENWVCHGGAVFKGEKEVITYAGITATPEHLVYSEQGWRTLESCRRLGLRIAKTGLGGNAIRLGENRFAGSERTLSTALGGTGSMPKSKSKRLASTSGAYENKRKMRVWDIRNAGPLHRFTVQGFLVHNCIDYADLLDASSMARDFRHQQNACWESLRGLAQERRCLVVTATQADARSYSPTARLGMSNFSEDKRKNAHVTAMFGLNQNDREKRLGIMYVNEIVVREGDFSPERGVYVMQALSMGAPFLGSYR